MTKLTRLTAALCLTAASAVGGAAAASAAEADYLVVNTTFKNAPHTISEAGGVFAGCTSVKDLGGTATGTGANRAVFEGSKRVTCDDGKFTLEYKAATAGSEQTVGTWWITSSTLSGANVGDGGSLRGDYSTCLPVGGCITDTFVMNG